MGIFVGCSSKVEGVRLKGKSINASKNIQEDITKNIKKIAEVEAVAVEEIQLPNKFVPMDYGFIERNHEFLYYDICSEPKYNCEDTILYEYLIEDIEFDKEICSKIDIAVPLMIDYHLFDFNADGLEDYLVCLDGNLWSGSAGNQVEIYIQEEDSSLRRVLHITIRIHNSDDADGHAPFAVLNETANGYYAIVLPWSSRILRYDKEKDWYVFSEKE